MYSLGVLKLLESTCPSMKSFMAWGSEMLSEAMLLIAKTQHDLHQL